jgi:hypothetical protein
VRLTVKPADDFAAASRYMDSSLFHYWYIQPRTGPGRALIMIDAGSGPDVYGYTIITPLSISGRRCFSVHYRP